MVGRGGMLRMSRVDPVLQPLLRWKQRPVGGATGHEVLPPDPQRDDLVRPGAMAEGVAQSVAGRAAARREGAHSRTVGRRTRQRPDPTPGKAIVTQGMRPYHRILLRDVRTQRVPAHQCTIRVGSE